MEKFLEASRLANDKFAEIRSNKVLDRMVSYDHIDKEATTVFERTLLYYIVALDDMMDVCSEEEYPSLKSIQLCFDSSIPDRLNTLRLEVLEYIRKEHTVYTAIYEFAKFLIVADALLLYHNDDTENVYSIAESEDSIKLMIITDDYNIGYYFTKQLTTDKNKSILEAYVDGDNQDSMIGFMEVKRNGGSETKTHFGFDMTGNFKSTSYKDYILFHTLINNTKIILESTYKRILDKAYPTYIGSKDDRFDLMEYLYGFRIRNNTTE